MNGLPFFYGNFSMYANKYLVKLLESDGYIELAFHLMYSINLVSSFKPPI